MSEQWRVRLPESLMKTIKAACDSRDLTSLEKLEAAVLICHGFGYYGSQETISPMQTAIPEDQWAAICQLLMDQNPGASIAKVSSAMDWLNVGPSGYKEEK